MPDDTTKNNHPEPLRQQPEDDMPIPPRRSRGKSYGQREEHAGSSGDAADIPSRRSAHPSERDRLARWFVNLLFVLLLALMAGLMYWGYYKFSDA